MKHITVPIGENCRVDGGPYWNLDGRRQAGDGEIAAVCGENDTKITVTLDEIEDALTDEMLDNQPIQLSTGDVGPGETVGTIKLPLSVGYRVEVDGISADSALLSNLVQYQRRRMFEDALKRHGGRIESV